VNDASRPEGGPPRPRLTLADARDVLARIIAAREELEYDAAHAAAILSDLENDLAQIAGAAR
jgi:hypothetical protein